MPEKMTDVVRHLSSSNALFHWGLWCFDNR